METITSKIVTARKEHICGLCGCKIDIGKKYIKQTNTDNNLIWNFLMHIECSKILSMPYFVGEIDGIDEDMYSSFIVDYIRTHHYNKDIDNVEEEWRNLSNYEATKKILDELKK